MIKSINVIWLLLLLMVGCSIKVPPGRYSTAPPPSSGRFAIAAHDINLSENGRFQYRFWSDDGPPINGSGGYVIFGKYIFLLFEKSIVPKSNYIKNEIPCIQQDSQDIKFVIQDAQNDPLIGVSIYNKNNTNQGFITQLDGVGSKRLPMEQGEKTFCLHYTCFDHLEIEIEGDKCYDIKVKMVESSSEISNTYIKLGKLKKEEDQLFLKMWDWKSYNKIYLREL